MNVPTGLGRVCSWWSSYLFPKPKASLILSSSQAEALPFQVTCLEPEVTARATPPPGGGHQTAGEPSPTSTVQVLIPAEVDLGGFRFCTFGSGPGGLLPREWGKESCTVSRRQGSSNAERPTPSHPAPLSRRRVPGTMGLPVSLCPASCHGLGGGGARLVPSSSAIFTTFFHHHHEALRTLGFCKHRHMRLTLSPHGSPSSLLMGTETQREER